jgi:hypothetical protein
MVENGTIVGATGLTAPGLYEAGLVDMETGSLYATPHEPLLSGVLVDLSGIDLLLGPGPHELLALAVEGTVPEHGCETVRLSFLEGGARNLVTCGGRSSVLPPGPELDVEVCPGPGEFLVGDDCMGVVPDLRDQVIGLDNCDPEPTVAQSPPPGTQVAAGVPTEIVFEATDASGNMSSAPGGTITFRDGTPPEILEAPAGGISPEPGSRDILPDLTGDVVAHDNCDPDPLITQSPPPGTRLVLGVPTAVTFEVTDESGNASSTSTTVTFGVLFRRGDANADGEVDIADAMFTLSWLFAEGVDPSCLDAADSNDDGEIDIADAIKTLGHLFAGEGDLPDPFGACGPDATEDELECASYSACE